MAIQPTTKDMFPPSHYDRSVPLIDSSVPEPGQTREAVKRTAGVALAGATLLAGAEVVGNAIDSFRAESDPSQSVKVLEPNEVPQDLPSPEEAIVHITQPGENATEIAAQYEDVTDVSNLKDKIHNAAKGGEDKGLDPGDRVVIPK